MSEPTADEIIADLESRGLAWCIEHIQRIIEVRIFKWPNIIGRYRPEAVEPMATMLLRATATINFNAYPVKST